MGVEYTGGSMFYVVVETTYGETKMIKELYFEK
jgi:hypothetical protein